MKKVFTLVAMVCMAMGASAQGTYAVQDGDAIAAGDKITTVPNATLTFSETGGTFSAGKAVANWVDEDFVAYTTGSTSGKFSAGSEPTGCYYKIETAKAGKVTTGIQLSPNKGFYVVNKNFEKVTDYTYNLPADKGGYSQTMTTKEKCLDIISAVGTISNGSVTFNVEAGGVYYVFAGGSKLGFFGFKYETDGGTSGINNVTTSEVNENAPVYNLSGQRVNKETKGILIQNGKKFINK